MLSQFKKGFFYTIIGQYGNMLITLLINIVLSRMLTPKDYGVVAVMSVFIVFFQMLSDMGIGPAIIQNQNLNDLEIAKIFNISMLFSVINAIAFVGVGYIISLIYDDYIYQSLSNVLAVAVFFFSAIVVPKAILKKNKKFKDINSVLLISSFGGGIIGIICALIGLGAFSLVINNVVSSALNFFFLVRKSQLKYTKVIDFKPIWKIFEFAKNQFAFNFFNYFSRNMDSFLIGKFISPTALGNYNKSYQLLMYPASIFNGVINPVLQPILSEYEQDVDTIKNVYFKLVHLLLLVGMPGSFFVSICSKEIIYFLFGLQWTESVFPLRILSLTIWIQIVNISTSAIYQSRNKTNYLLLNGILSSIIIVSSIILGVYFKNIRVVSVTLSLGFILNFLISMDILLKKVLDSKWKDILNLFIFPSVISIMIIVSMLLFQNYVQNFIVNNFLLLLVQSIFFILIYILGLYVTKEYKIFFKYVKK